MPEETLTKTVKKVIRWGKGFAVFITKEAKQLGWTDKDHVVISVIKNGNDERIVIKRAKIEY